MKTIIALVVLTASVFGQQYPVGVVPGSPEDLAARKPAFRSSLTDLTRIGCKLRPDLGSGVNTEYGVITCWHCVSSGKPIDVECDGEVGRGTVIAKDEAADVALIAVPWTRQHPTVPVADGSPYGLMSLIARQPTGPIGIQKAMALHETLDGLWVTSEPTVAGQSGGGYIGANGDLVGIVSGNVVDVEPFRGLIIPAKAIRKILPANATRRSAGVADAPTPYAEIERVLNLLPKPQRGFVDFGCGADARWCLAAAEKWQVKCVGMEIDPTRARLAQERVKQEGFADLIEIYCADSTAYAYPNCDVGVAFLYPETLQKLKPQIEGLTAFASMFHHPPVPSVQNGNAWIYRKPAMAVARQAVGYWNGVAYSAPMAGCSCEMCRSIAGQIAAAYRSQSTDASPQPKGHYEIRKDCSGRSCKLIKVWVSD